MFDPNPDHELSEEQIELNRARSKRIDGERFGWCEADGCNCALDRDGICWECEKRKTN